MSRGTGISLSGDVLSPGVVRRMACDAQIIPMVLGGDSKPLDVGRRKRLFTRSQRLALGVRDKGCSLGGLHHATELVRGPPRHPLGVRRPDHPAQRGPALPRHHTEVHHRGLTATVTALGVTWHT